jgi:hypothetical protein
VYDASNPNNVLHVFEDWSTYATIGEIGVKARVDGGGPWSNNQSPSSKTFSTTNNDPWFGTKTVTINLQDRPADNAAHNRGFVLTNTSTSPAPFLNASSARESIVIEWAVRQSGEAIYVGKIADWNPQGSPQLYRFNLQNSYDRLGSRVYSSCDPDPLCNAYYANNGSTPRFSWLPKLGAFGDQFARSFSEGGTPTVHHWTQNRNHGSGTGRFDYAASLDGQNRRISPFLDNVWRRYIVRLTLNQPGQPAGHGRVEQWIQRYPEPPVKVMDFIGDVGGADQGLIHTGPSGGHWINPSAHIHWYGLTAVGQIFKGGNTLHLGYFRMWSHPRQ